MRKTLTTVSALVLGLAALPGEANAQSLMETFAKAYLSNPTLEARRAQVRGADENVNQALSLWRPTVTFRGSSGINYQDDNIGFGGTSSGRADGQSLTPHRLAVTINQPLYRGGSNPAALRQAEGFVLSERSGLLSTEQQVLQEAGIAYMNVVRDQAVVELNHNNEEVLRRQLGATRDRFQVGEVTRTDVSQAMARVSRAIADLRSSEGDLETSRADYEQVVGLRPGVLSQPPPIPGLPTSRQQAIELAWKNNPAVMVAVFAQIAAVREVRVIMGELLPQVSLVGDSTLNFETSAEDLRSAQVEARVEMTIPLYESGAVRSRVRQAKHRASQRLVQVEEARRAAIEAATAGWEQLSATRNRIAALRAEVESQEIALDGVQQEALVGTRTVLDVLDAEQELLSSRVNLIRAQRDEVVASLALAAAAGLLTAESMDLDVPRYDVRANYEQVRGAWFGTDIGSPWNPADK